ncbi:hypothetical protein NDU88_001462 [Pleurodeles waltl]|uniref:Uncharacterized protein n=1 Tax=Pleurodeles waltl TaxID=8319 RepID=A0AAV7KSW7_PLEWA|nr:hypothetical protein NDU88_001462 [Pleurodeles waltl]
MVPVVWQEKKETEGRRRVEADKYQMGRKPWGPVEKTLQRRTAAQRIHPPKEGEDAQRPATFWEKFGPIRYKLRPQRDMGRKDMEI